MVLLKSRVDAGLRPRRTLGLAPHHFLADPPLTTSAPGRYRAARYEGSFLSTD